MATHPLTGQTLKLGTSGHLRLLELIHQYPGKRWIFRGELDDGQPVAAKIYRGNLRQGIEWLRGVRGIRHLCRSGIPAPNLEYAGYNRKAGGWLAVLEWISADAPWPPDDDPAGTEKHERMLEALIAHHLAGIQQSDMNPRNFIPRNGQLVTIDGDRIRKRRAPLGRRRSLNHLVRIYASKSRLPEEELRQMCRRYSTARGWPLGVPEENRLVETIQRARVDHARQVALRGARGWKHYPRQRHGNLEIFHDRRRIPPEQALALAQRIAHGEYQGPDSHAFPLPAWQTRTIESRRPGAATWIADALRRDRVLRTWVNELALRRLGFSVHRNVMMIRRRQGGSAWLLCEPIDATPLERCIRAMGSDECERVLQAIRGLLTDLRLQRIRHRDMRIDHLGWDGTRIWLLDAADVFFHPKYLPGFTHRWAAEIDHLAETIARTLGVTPGTIRTAIAPIGSEPEQPRR